MSKTIILTISLLVCCLAITPLDQYKNMAKRDLCRAEKLQALEPHIKTIVSSFARVPSILTQDKQNPIAKAAMMGLFKQADEKLNECEILQIPIPKIPAEWIDDFNWWIQVTGIGFFMSAGCFQGVGVYMTIIQQMINTPIEDIYDLQRDIITLYFIYLQGVYAVQACEQAFNYVFQWHL